MHSRLAQQWHGVLISHLLAESSEHGGKAGLVYGMLSLGSS
jgi:hypothetical protein